MTDNNLLTLRRLDNFNEFCGIKAQWDALASDKLDTIFLTHDWLCNWWKFYGSNCELWTLVAEKNGKMLGVAPLMLQHGPNGFRRLTFMGSGEVTPNYLDIIADSDAREDFLRALAEYLLQSVSHWDMLELDKLPVDTCTLDQLSLHLRSQGFVVQVDRSARCAYEELPDSFEAYLLDLKTRHPLAHHNLFKRRRRLERRLTEIRFDRVRTQEELERTMTALIRLHQARWTKRGYVGAFSNERFIGFHKAEASDALLTGHLRIFFLEIESDIAAVSYCYRIGDVLQSYLGGFDSRFAEFSPGTLIRSFVIEQSIIEGARRFDLLEGEEEYKSEWATRTRDNMRLRVFSPHLHGQFVKGVTLAGETFKMLGVRYVPKKIRRPIWQAMERFRVAYQKK